MAADYLVKLDAFEGPMDLLMHLIEKNKIDLYDIPIADLTRQYLLGDGSNPSADQVAYASAEK